MFDVAVCTCDVPVPDERLRLVFYVLATCVKVSVENFEPSLDKLSKIDGGLIDPESMGSGVQHGDSRARLDENKGGACAC